VLQSRERRKAHVFEFGLDARVVISISQQTKLFNSQKVHLHTIPFVFGIFASKIMTISLSGKKA
jgi:hypothetical protein